MFTNVFTSLTLQQSQRSRVENLPEAPQTSITVWPLLSPSVQV